MIRSFFAVGRIGAPHKINGITRKALCLKNIEEKFQDIELGHNCFCQFSKCTMKVAYGQQIECYYISPPKVLMSAP